MCVSECASVRRRLAKAMHLMRSSAFLISLIFPTARSKRIHSEGTSALLVSTLARAWERGHQTLSA